MRLFIAASVASALFVSTALAADMPALAPGKPAGVRQADIEAGGVVMWLGIAGIAAGIAILASGTQGHSSATTTQ